MTNSFTPYPQLSELDPRLSSEGNLDPLGLYSIADALAGRLAPGIRQRQGHPRFLTAIAVGLELTDTFPEEMATPDGSEPWQVYEWIVVQGLVDRLSSEYPEELVGIPGRDKVTRVLEQNIPLSAKQYLKTPGTFGFHGVYRVLAKELKIEHGNSLGEFGSKLVETWTKEQGLSGFIGTDDGPGRKLKSDLRNALTESLKLGAVAKKRNWHQWDFFMNHLSPYRVGEKESAVLFNALADTAVPLRREIIQFLESAEGQRIWNKEDVSERIFHKALQKKASPQLNEILSVIDLYERFSRLLQDAFDDCLYMMTSRRGPVTPSELALTDGVQVATKLTPALVNELADRLEPLGQAIRFEETFSTFKESSPPAAWAQLLFDHHKKIQERKPPNGKAPWVETTGNGNLFVRTPYRREEGGTHDERYVHGYRTTPIWSFLRDLKRVSS